MLKISNNQRVWLISDIHFNHNKDFLYGDRGFDTVHNMNNQLLKNFKETINYNDIVFILGDNWLGDLNEGWALFQQVPGIKYLIRGNHDTDTRWDFLTEKSILNPFINILGEAATVKIHGYLFFLSHYPTATTNFNDYEKPLQHRVLNISGHTHSTEKWQKDVPSSYNVSLEAHNLCPVNIDTIISDFKEKYK